MKQKYRTLAILALFISLLSISIPRMHTIEDVSVSEMEHYPVLQKAYDELCAEYSFYDIQPDDIMQIVTIQNLWGSWERYILPCYSVNVPTIPKAGSTSGYAGLFILAPWSEENLFTNLYRLKIRDLWLCMDSPENLFVYEHAKVTTANIYPVRHLVYSKSVTWDEAIICDRQPTVMAEYSLATNNSAAVKDEQVLTKFTWAYTLRFMGHNIRTCHYILNAEHLLNV